VVAITIAEPEGGGGAAARAFAAVFAPFECRQTAVDGNVLLFAASGPRARDPAATRRWLAEWDARGVTDFSLTALAAEATGGAACDRLLGGAVTERRPPPAAVTSR
jgi:hypothetical protein